MAMGNHPAAVTPEVVRHGYVYGPKTAIGFEKMRQRGIPLPPFAIQDLFADVVRRAIEREISQAEKVAAALAIRNGIKVGDDQAGAERFLKELRREVVESESALTDGDKNDMLRQLADGQRWFFQEFFNDSPMWLQYRVAYAIQEADIFPKRMERILSDYLDIATEKINEGMYDTRKVFLSRMTEYIHGESDLSGLSSIIKATREEVGVFSQFFARDQFARFNRSLCLGTLSVAGVKRAKWWTMLDGDRVRLTHRKLHGVEFDIDDPPEDIKKAMADYNCRCSFLGVIPD